MGQNIEAARVVINITTNADKATRDMKGLEKQGEKTARGFRSLKPAVVGTVAAIAAVSAGLIAVGKDLVASFAEQEQAEARLNQTLKSTGFAAGLTASELKNLASELQGVTKFGDEAIIGAESLLLTFKNVGEDVFPRALESILDVSEALGQDLQSSTIQLGKALNDPVQGLTALRRIGITLTKADEDLVKSFAEVNDISSAQAIILRELESQFGGVARAAAETATGGLTQLGNVAGDTKELLGGLLSEALEPLALGFKNALLGINQFIVAQQALKATEEGLADIDQLRIVRQKELAAVFADQEARDRANLELQEALAEADIFRDEQTIRRLENVVALREAELTASEDSLRAISRQIDAKQEEIDAAQETAAARVAADSAAAASALEASEATTAAVEESTEAQISALEFFTEVGIDRYNALLGAAEESFEGATVASDTSTEKIVDNFDLQAEASTTALEALTDGLAAAGEAFATGEDAAAGFAKASILAIAGIADALVEFFSIQAAGALAKVFGGNFAALAEVAQWTAAAGLASIGSGVIKGFANSFQTGTGPDAISRVSSAPDANIAFLQPGESFNVGSEDDVISGSGSGEGMTINIRFGDRLIGSVVTRGTKDGTILIDENSVRAL